jgi:hypothetical protein
MDRAVLWAALMISGALIACGALFVLRDYANPVFVNGADTASRIDAETGDMIAARFPDVSVGTARCPPVLDLTGTHRGRCNLPIADGQLRIDVVPPYMQGLGVVLQDVDALFVTRDAERSLRAQLAERYGEQFDLHCPGPPVRIIADKAKVTCSIEAPDMLRRGIEVTVSGNAGAVRPAELIGVPTRIERSFGADVAARTEGTAVIAGPAMERYVLGSAGANADGEVGRRGLLGVARCPPRIVLRERDRATCTVRVGGQTLRYDVQFETGRGLEVRADKHVAVIAVLREIATRYFERPKYTGGKPLVARVDCGKNAVALVEPGSLVPCTAKVNAVSYSCAFQFDDAQGDFHIVVES